MEHLALELTCKLMCTKDGALIELKKRLRLARNNQARLRRENAQLKVCAFNATRLNGELAKEIANYIVNVYAISCAMAKMA